jgi:glycosyltransferase involved in cell wall biosynthesis
VVENSEKIRVLRIIARMNVGGPAVQVTGIAQNINQKIFDHLLVTGSCEQDEIDYLDTHEMSLPLLKIDGLGRSVSFKSDIKAFLKIRSLIKEYKPHIIHTHTAKAGFLGRAASLTVFRRSKLVHTFHGHLLFGYFSPLKTKMVVIVERLLAIFTNNLIGVGQQVVDDLVKARIGNPKKFIVINPGLEVLVRQDRSQVRRKLGISNEVFVISWVGRFVDIKAPERVIEIAQNSQINQEGLRFIMIGGGALLDATKQASEKLDLPIDFLGWRNDPEDLIAASDLLLMTSKNEGTPLSVIQAQVLGIPVLTTDVGAIGEIVDKNKTGFIEPYGAKKFQDLILLMSREKSLWLAQSNEAKKQSGEKFSVSRLVADHERLYKKIISDQAN